MDEAQGHTSSSSSIDIAACSPASSLLHHFSTPGTVPAMDESKAPRTAPTSSPPPRQHYPGSCTPPVHPTPPSGAPVVLTPPGAFSLLPAPNAHSPQRCFTPRRPIHPPTVFPSPALHPPPSAAAPRPLSKKVEAALKSIE